MDFTTVALQRHSTRAFKPDIISSRDLETIVNVGCTAPVGMRAYDSLLITVIKDKSVLAQISKTVTAIHNDFGSDIFYGAPLVVIISSSTPIFEGIDYSNGACVVQNMLLAATDLGIDSVYLYGPCIAFREDPNLYELVKIPSSYHPVAAVALGYSALDAPPEKILEPTIKIKHI